MTKANQQQIVQSGDAVQSEVTLSPAMRTDEMLTEMRNLYLGRCKALLEGNMAAVELFNRQINSLKLKLSKI